MTRKPHTEEQKEMYAENRTRKREENPLTAEQKEKRAAAAKRKRAENPLTAEQKEKYAAAAKRKRAEYAATAKRKREENPRTAEQKKKYAANKKLKRAEYAATAKRKREEARAQENDQVAKAHQEKYPDSTDPLLRRAAVEEEVRRIVSAPLGSFEDYLHTDEENGGKIGGALGSATLEEIFENAVDAVVYAGVTGRRLGEEGFEFASRVGCVLNWTEDADENTDLHGNRRDKRTLTPQQCIKKLGFYVISVYSSQHSQNAYLIESRLQAYLSSISAVRGKPRLWVRDDPGRKIEGVQESVACNMHRVYVTVSAEAYEKIHGDDKQLVIT